jgi:hypothetical protein
MHPDQKILIFWDGAKYHTGEVMKNFLEEVNGNLDRRQWRLVCNLFGSFGFIMLDIISQLCSSPCKIPRHQAT